jgi:dephospho-CoA kinase
VILVDAPAELRRARLLASRGLSADEADALLAAQAPSGPKRARSTYVIDNDADRATLEARTLDVWNALLRLT